MLGKLKTEYTFCLVLIFFLFSQIIVKAEWQDSSEKQLSQLKAKAAMIMAVLDPSVPTADLQQGCNLGPSSGRRGGNKGPSPTGNKKRKKTGTGDRENNKRRKIVPRNCQNEEETGGLTESMLKQILNTGLQDRLFNQGFSTMSTYVTVDFGKKVYRQTGSESHAEDNLFKSGQETKMMAKQNGIWLNNSPCTRCAKTIMNKYHGTSGKKPTIYVQNIYTGGTGLKSTVASLECLAKMIKEGFDIKPWAWNTFKNKLKNVKCKQAINSASEDDAFKEKEKQVEMTIEFLNAMKDCVPNNWCR